MKLFMCGMFSLCLHGYLPDALGSVNSPKTWMEIRTNGYSKLPVGVNASGNIFCVSPVIDCLKVSDGWINKWIDGFINKWMNEWMDKCINGWID